MTVAKVDLLRFTFQSLYFCGVPVEHLSGERFCTSVNHWYMPLIRSGWAVPLSFVVDVGTLLQRPTTALRSRWKENVRDDIKRLTLRYHEMLIGLRRQPVFERVVDLVARAPHQAQRDQATKAFLRVMLAAMSHFRETYAFDSRDLHLRRARPGLEMIRDVSWIFNGKSQKGHVSFGDPTLIRGRNEFGTIVDLLEKITDYFTSHRLNTFISREEQLLIEVMGRSPATAGKVDYRFLHELLGRSGLEDPEAQEPHPPRVEQILPTDSYETDGQVGGYIDVNRQRFTGELAQVLPMELAFVRHPTLMAHKLLNEWALHFVREDIECIERELHVLVCIVVDVNDRMLAAPAEVNSAFGKGMTPYIRARVLAALVLMDLARHFPRENVRVDCGLFLWSSQARHTYRTEFDLLASFSRETAGDRYEFAAALAERAPYLFFNRVPAEASKENPALDGDPGQYLLNRARSRAYHCRHLLHFSSEHSARQAFSATDPGLHAWDVGRDSFFVTNCDVQQTTLGVYRPRTVNEAADPPERSQVGQLTEERLRGRILDTLLLKAADKMARTDEFDALSDLP